MRFVCPPLTEGYRSGVAGRGGWRRLGRTRFRYVDSSGREIRDEEQLERIRSLVIPPAWRDVWISPSPRARIQATGIDAAGRKQYRYHESYRAARERAKFDRLLHFADALPRLRGRASQHLRRDPLEREWTCALAIGLVNKAWFRVGTDTHARRSRTYGVTTLTKRHVSVVADEVRFCFRTKNRKLVRRSIQDATLATCMAELLEVPGARVFRYEREGELVALTGQQLNAYLGEHMGDGFTAKDFRTWGGTLLAATELARRGPAPDERAATRTVAAVMRTVATELGNTPAVARASYVSPSVVDAYLGGRTLEEFRSPNGSVPRRLSADERALVALLRSTRR